MSINDILVIFGLLCINHNVFYKFIVNKLIFKLALPNIISNITIPLIGLIDLALMGHLGSEANIGAISVGSMIFNFIYWGFGFLRMSTSGFTAQGYGNGNKSECFHILLRGLLLSSVISLIIVALQVPIEWLSFKLINGSQVVESLSKEYFRIRIWAAPATLALYVINGWFLGMQNAKFVMISSILSNLLNLIFSFVFVFVFKMESAGVALGTVIAQYVGLFASLYLLKHSYSKLFFFFRKELIFKSDFIKSFFRVNTDIFIRTFCVIMVFTLFTSKSAGINDHILAVNSVLIQFLMFFSFFIDGFAFAGEALAGKFVGMNNKDNFVVLTKKLFKYGFALSILFSTIYAFANKLIIFAITSDIKIYETAKEYIIWIILIPIISFASFVWDGIYIGITASREMRNSMLASSIFLFAPCFYFLQKPFGNHALWIAMLMFMLGRAVFQTILFNKLLNKAFV